MNSDPSEEFSKAKSTAFRLLKIRSRSEHEIKERLKRKTISPEIVERTVLYLKNQRLLDDQKFARDWINARLTKSYGLRRIAFELKEKGINSELINEELSCAREDYNEENIVRELAKRCKEKYKNTDKTKRKRRIFEYLARRGFSLEAIAKALEHL